MIFVAVVENSGALFDLDVVDQLRPIKTQLRLPFEFFFVEDGVSDEPIHDISLMDLDNDQGVDFFALDPFGVGFFQIWAH